MAVRRITFLVLAMTMGSIAWCAETKTGRPPCDSRRVGQFWPEHANANSQAVYKSARNGELQICTRHVYRYRWETLTVSYQHLTAVARLKQHRSAKKKAGYTLDLTSRAVEYPSSP